MKIIGIIVVVAVLAIGGWFVLSQNNQQTSAPAETGAMMEKTNDSMMKEESSEEAMMEESTTSPIAVEGGMFYFEPNEIRVKKGEKVTITFTNKEGLHDFTIDEFNVSTNQIAAGESETIEFTPDQAGEFEFYCSVGDHRQKGMVGTLIVEE